MRPTEFIKIYKDCFGDNATLPLAVVYSDVPMGESGHIPGCIFKQFHRAYNGETVSFSTDNLTCGGGKLYSGLGPVQERIFDFVSNVE